MGGLVHLDEPLLGGAKDDRIVAAPAVRITVLVRMMAQQRAAIGEKFYDNGIRRENVFAFVFGQAFRVHTTIIERRVNFEVVALTGNEVVGAMSWSGVHDAAALIECDVVGEDAGHFNGQEGMLKLHAVEFATFERGDNFGFGNAAICLQRRDAIGGQQEAALLRLNDGVVEIRMEGECAVMRNGPGSGGPDDGRNVGANFGIAIGDLEGDPDRRTGVIFVFDFGFGQGGVVVDAPVNRLAAAIDVALFHKVEEGTGDGGLVLVAHGEVGIVPAAEDAEAFEIALVLLDVPSGVVAATLAEL